MDKRYTVRQAMEMTGVKAYVLRYWEDELELKIHRNELGHRYYTGYDIQLFLNIKELKNRGLQLRAIRDLIPQMSFQEKRNPEITDLRKTDGAEACSIIDAQEEKHSEHENKILEFQAILERLITQELQNKNEEEERCRSLDLAIRKQQLARREAAAAAQKKHKMSAKAD